MVLQASWCHYPPLLSSCHGTRYTCGSTQSGNCQLGEEFNSHGLTPLACFASKLILKTINPLGTIRWEGNQSNAVLQHSKDSC
jgi:hypothetical protein